jgi:preprotein translocase subunit SecA
MLDQRTAGRPLARGLDAAWDGGLGCAKRLALRQGKFLRRSQEILQLEAAYSELTDAVLRKKADELREVFRCGKDTAGHLNHSFALVREVALRKIGEKPFGVQVAGALALERGCVAEMATGEGKTLAATMAVTAAGWRGRGCHVVTVNDYLAKRDAEWMGPIYGFCGLRVAHVEQGMSPAERRRAYDADVTYCTNKEVAADFLRDRLHIGRCEGLGPLMLEKITGGGGVLDRLVQRGLHFAIVDEADSILVDEAVTPLIISTDSDNPEQNRAFTQAADIAAAMSRGTDYRLNLKYREVELTDAGRDKLVEMSRGLGGAWQGARRGEEMMIQALVAKEFYHRDKQYIVDDGKVVIVDEFTGRLMPDRTWRDGLHQAVEAKDRVRVNAPKETCARISFQRFFRIYRKLAGMTGTAMEAWREFWQIYHLPVVAIPTNRPCVRKVLPPLILPTQDEKWKVIVEAIEDIHRTGCPVLVGTRSVQSSQRLSRLLESRKLPHQVLNAIHHRREAEIVAGAGRRGKLTVATNMAGRGTDIKLGRGVAELGGLHVLSAELNESARIDRQLFGRAARQGDPGSARAIVSLEDEYVCRYAEKAASLLRKGHDGPGGRLWNKLAGGSFRIAQLRAERHALKQRKTVLRTDNWLDEHLGFAGREGG